MLGVGRLVLDEPVVVTAVRVPCDVVQDHQPLELQLEPGDNTVWIYIFVVENISNLNKVDIK